jgi:hypothetical protein
MIIAHPVSASVSKPSVPEFSVAYVDHSYDVPPVYGKDSYTGQTIIKVSGSHVDNRTVDVTIQNQPFTLYLDSNNNTVGLHYSIRSKGRFDDWSESSGHVTNGVQASTISVFTVVSIDIGYWGVHQEGQIDFQVAAVSGYPASEPAYCGQVHFNTVDQSDWSSSQTITIGNPITATPTQQPYTWPTPTAIPYATATSSPQQTPTATPTQPNILTNVLFGSNWEQTLLIGMAIVIVVLVVSLVVVILRKMAMH